MTRVDETFYRVRQSNIVGACQFLGGGTNTARTTMKDSRKYVNNHKMVGRVKMVDRTKMAGQTSTVGSSTMRNNTGHVASAVLPDPPDNFWHQSMFANGMNTASDSMLCLSVLTAQLVTLTMPDPTHG